MEDEMESGLTCVPQSRRREESVSMGRGGTSSRIELGAKKREMEVKGSIYNYDKWTCSFVSPWSRLGGACQTLPRHFSLLNSHSHWPSPAHPIPSPLRGISASTYTIVDRDPLPSPKQCSIPPFSLVSVTTFPLSSDFSHPFRMSRPTTTAKRHQSHHPIPSQIPRSPPIFHKDLALSRRLILQLTSFLPPRLTSLSPPHAPCSPHSNCRPSCARDTANHAFFCPLHGFVGQV